MPDDMLISQLESLRETYTQKQKATNALISGLKNAASALVKASRALDDYADTNGGLDEAGLAQAQQGIGAARLKEEVADALLPDLRREVKAYTTVSTGLKDAIAALYSDPVDVVRLDHAYANVGSFSGQDATLDDLMPGLAAEIEQAQKQLGNVFGVALRETMAEIGVEVTGTPPRFEVGRYEIAADFVTRKATISYGKIEVAKNVPLSLDAILRAYQREVKAIEGRSEDGQSWIRQLHKAWETAMLKSGKSSHRAGIVDCYYEMVLLRQNRTFNNDPSKRSFADYSRAQFTYDLVGFVWQQHLNYEGLNVELHTATQSHWGSSSKCMWVVDGNGPHDGRYVSDIEFGKG
jgi:uncharacterized lipoprotein YmbA